MYQRSYEDTILALVIYRALRYTVYLKTGEGYYEHEIAMCTMMLQLLLESEDNMDDIYQGVFIYRAIVCFEDFLPTGTAIVTTNDVTTSTLEIIHKECPQINRSFSSTEIESSFA